MAEYTGTPCGGKPPPVIGYRSLRYWVAATAVILISNFLASSLPACEFLVSTFSKEPRRVRSTRRWSGGDSWSRHRELALPADRRRSLSRGDGPRRISFCPTADSWFCSGARCAAAGSSASPGWPICRSMLSRPELRQDGAVLWIVPHEDAQEKTMRWLQVARLHHYARRSCTSPRSTESRVEDPSLAERIAIPPAGPRGHRLERGLRKSSDIIFAE